MLPACSTDGEKCGFHAEQEVRRYASQERVLTAGVHAPKKNVTCQRASPLQTCLEGDVYAYAMEMQGRN